VGGGSREGRSWLGGGKKVPGKGCLAARSAAHVLIAAGSGCRTRQERSYILALQDDEQEQQEQEQQE
jgi:hypothetical protein